MDALLDSVYLNPSSSAYLAGTNAVYRQAKIKDNTITYRAVVEYLQGKDVYTLHKPLRKRFLRNRVVPDGLNSDWQADLISLPSLTKYNRGHAYILVCIDVLSKFMYAEPLKQKKPEHVRDAFKLIFARSHALPWRITTDKGREFTGRALRSFLEEKRITHFTANSPDVKASNAERAVRTLKTRLYKHITHRNNFSYLKILPKLVAAINSTVSRVTKLAPKDINENNADKVLQRVYGAPKFPVTFKFAVGDIVRISKYKHLMEKGYKPNYTDEKFVISDRLHRHPVVYKLEDTSGEEITGIFYESELSKCRKTANGSFSDGKSQKA